MLQVHQFGLGCIKLSTSKGYKVHPKWYSDWSTCTVFDTSNNFAEGRVHCTPLFFQHHSDQAMARRTRDTDAGVEECKGYSPPNDHTTSASSTPLPLGSWNLNASTRTTESERSARLAFQSEVYCCTKVCS